MRKKRRDVKERKDLGDGNGSKARERKNMRP